MRIPTFSSVLGLALVLGLCAAAYTLVTNLPSGSRYDHYQRANDGTDDRATEDRTALQVRGWLREGERKTEAEAQAHWERWRTLAERLVAGAPGNREAWYAVGWARRKTGDEAKAKEAWRKVLVMLEGKTEAVEVYDRGCMRALLGDTDGALADLRAALGTGAIRTGTVVRDPDLRGLVDDPRFQELLKTLPPEDEFRPTQT